MTRLDRGLTLIEVLIAVAVIGLAFGILAMTQVTNLRVTSDSRLASQATDFANRTMERVVRCILASPEAFEEAKDGGICDDGAFTSGQYSGTVSVVSAGNAYEQEGLVSVTVHLDTPSVVTFSRLVSCIDVEPPPTIAVPHPCPPATAPPPVDP